ncbi:MAG: hypothetical protein QOH76_1405 [Thermoleophilaceae bacterium]|nr:hypothetical protein [Thermoleophilaceae bacterium]
MSHDKQGLFLVLVGFLLSFGFIRVSARLGRSPRVPWWPGSVVSDSGVHLHHLVWGICLMLGAGTLGFALFQKSPGLEICAALFGVGAGFTVDEFALWVYLDDVYWAKEGRASIDAAVIAATVMLLALLGAQPFEVQGGSAVQIVIELSVAGAVIALGAVCFAKQRLMHGVLGVFFFPIAIYGASRVGKPRSPWGRRFYRGRKLAKAEQRFGPERRTERFKERFRDAVGGETDAVYQAKLAERTAAAEAAAAVRERAERASS